MKIPYDWAIINQYNQKFLNDYLEVINSFGIGNLSIVSLKEDESFKNYKQMNSYNGIKNNLFYTIKIEPNGESSLEILFKLLMNLYNGNIAGMFMQLRRQFSTLTDWQVYILTEIFNYRMDGVCRITNNVGKKGFIMIPNIFSMFNSLDTVMESTNKNGLSYKDNMVYISVPPHYHDIFDKSVDNKNYVDALNNYTQLIK